MVELDLVLKGGSLILSVAKYTGIIQDKLKLKVEQLAGSELDAGVRALQQAAESEHEQRSLLREARSRFNKAISLEQKYRLAAAHLGLALCHARLGDAVNAANAIAMLAKVELPGIPILLKFTHFRREHPVLIGIAIQFVPFYILFGPHPSEEVIRRLEQHEQQVAALAELQKEANLLLEQSLRDGCEQVFGLLRESGR